MHKTKQNNNKNKNKTTTKKHSKERSGEHPKIQLRYLTTVPHKA